MRREYNEIAYNIELRKKEYEVFVRTGSTSIATIRFKYNCCILKKEVYIPENATDEIIYKILYNALKERIYEYNKMHEMRKGRII